MNDACVFCRIVNGSIQSATIYEDDEFIAFLDSFPASLGHTLIVPKNHTANIFEIDAAKAGRLFALATVIAKALKEALGCDGMNVLQNNGIAAGQTVFHYHVHLIPRYENDGMTIPWKIVKPPQDQVERLVVEMKNKLASV